MQTRATACGWSWCSMWLASLTYSSRPVRHVREPARDLLARIASAATATAARANRRRRSTARDTRCGARSRRRRRCGTSSGTGACASHPRATSPCRRAARGPVRRQELRFLAGEPPIGLLQAIRDSREARVGRERRRIAHRVEPVAKLVGRAIGGVAGNAERVERDDARTPSRAACRPTTSRRCRRGYGRRHSRARPARAHGRARRGRRRNRETSNRPAASPTTRSRASRAPAPATRARTRRPGTGRTRTRPSIRAAGRAWARRVAPRTHVIRQPAHVDELRACEACNAASLSFASVLIYACIARDRPASRRGSCRPCRSDRRPCARCRDPSSSRRRSPLDTPAGILADSRAEAAPARRERSVRMARQASRA